MLKRFIPYLIIIQLSILSVLPLFHKGIYPTHDAEYHLIRFYEFYRSFMGGSFYPRWAPDLNYGFGVPLFNYVYPLPNYAALILHFLGFSFIDSFKASLVIASLIGAIFFYLWSREFWGDWGGAVSCVFYLFSPYRFVDIYIRGSIGEVWAISLFPVCLWAITVFRKNKNRYFFIIAVVSLALVIFSHNILGLMFFIFFLFYIILLSFLEDNNRYLLVDGLWAAILSLGLSAVFWLPALFEKKLVTGLEIYNVFNNFPELFQLIFPAWGSGFAVGITADQISFQIGVANILAIMLGVFSLIYFVGNKNKKMLRINLIFLVFFAIIFFLMLKQSYFLWEIIPLMDYFQFPWRLLSLVIIVAPFLAGSFIYLLKNNKKIIVSVLLIFFSILLTWSYARPDHYFDRNDFYYLSRSNFIDGTNSPGNLFNTIWWDSSLKSRATGRLYFSQDKTRILSEDIKPAVYSFKVLSLDTVIGKVNTAYFPNWRVFIDGKETKVSPTKEGIFSFKMERGEHLLEVKFLSTFLEKIAAFISIIFLFIGFSLIIFKLRYYSQKHL